MLDGSWHPVCILFEGNEGLVHTCKEINEAQIGKKFWVKVTKNIEDLAHKIEMDQEEQILLVTNLYNQGYNLDEILNRLPDEYIHNVAELIQRLHKENKIVYGETWQLIRESRLKQEQTELERAEEVLREADKRVEQSRDDIARLEDELDHVRKMNEDLVAQAEQAVENLVLIKNDQAGKRRRRK
jgi:hypothetical protein